ncbi:MAG TPA: ROK family protein [Caproiciproducens sp.]|nr:ROK family protein [Caproiciproducens sp.]
MDNTNKSLNQGKIQMINRSLVLDLIRQEKICSRATLSKLSGLKQTTITNIVSDLMKCQLVVETGLMNGEKGRRSIGLRLNDEKYKVIGIRMTRLFFYIGLFGISGDVHNIKTYKIPHDESVDITTLRIRNAIQITLDENKDCNISAITMAMPGPYREDIDRLLFVTELTGWQNFAIKEALTKDLKIPLYIVNDADASAFSQYWYRNKKYLIYVLAGQGIGNGMVVNGKLACGSKGLAGEFGHTSINFDGPKCGCGNRGCIEKYCSLLVLYDNIKNRLKAGEVSCLVNNDINTENVARAVQNRDPVACEEYKKVCVYLSIGIINLINQNDPDTIVIGDELTQIAPDMLLTIVNDKVRECVNPLVLENLSIEINQLPESPCLLGGWCDCRSECSV